jgi:death-on-curing protein
MFGAHLHKTIYDKASAYLFHIVQNHPFNDGNKRTGAITTILFLEENGIEIIFTDNDFEEFVILVAQGKRNKEEISYFLEHGHEN